VGIPGATWAGPPAAPVSAPGGGSTGTAPIDLNTATLEELETLPGVGPVLGQNILDWRDAHGRFTSLDQLRDVTGIGDVRFGQLQPLVTLS
jgi:competence protein ComEA